MYGIYLSPKGTEDGGVWIYVIVIIVLVLLLVGSQTFSWYRRKRISASKLDEIDLQDTDVSPIDKNALELPELPKWLKERPDMIYPQTCIERGQQLGDGQFGTVFKGKLVLGKSV